MKRKGWIEADERGGYRLTPDGQDLLAATRPGWKRAQEKLRGAMKDEADWDRMMSALNMVAQAAREP
jgi:DNA-binding PadR family transcriptional regulator